MGKLQKLNALPLARRVAAYAGLVFVALLLMYGIGRPIQIWMGNFYDGERAPYLQMPSPTAVTLRWQTADPEQGVLRFGLAPDRLEEVVEEAGVRKEHELRVTGLKPGTRYYYSIGNRQGVRYSGPDYWFVTPWLAGSVASLRLAVLGDPGYAGEQHLAIRDHLLEWGAAHPRPGRPAFDMILTTGDNAYRSGTNEQFQDNFFDVYARIFPNTPVWPAYGNHDARRWAFFRIFSLPEQAESGGVPSATEHYYSFDNGELHVVMLDSFDGAHDPDDDMLQWLRRDLAANTRKWTIAVFHHPPYSKGSHDSDDGYDSRGRMFHVRENVLPVLEEYGVDLVLTGHSHSYERSRLIDCHYGTSDTFIANMVVDAGVKDAAGITTYRKSTGSGSHQGALYAVVGSTAKLNTRPTLNHPVMDVGLLEYGALIVDVDGDTLTGRFITDAGQVKDHFVLVKDRDSPAFVSPCH